MPGLLTAVLDRRLENLKTAGLSPAEVGDWEERPLSLRLWCESPEHLNFKFSEAQYGIMEEFIGPDGTRFFEKDLSRANTAIWLLGKGSGKDTMARAIALYSVYVLLCLRNPRAWLGFPGLGHVDIVNVAYSSDQAKSVYFSPFVEQVKIWRWLRSKFRIMSGGKMIYRPVGYGNRLGNFPVTYIKDDRVIFPKGIWAISEHSQQESYEGHDVLMWVADEASAFKTRSEIANADDIYNTLRTSANSRFSGRWRGVIMSYPRGEADTDFTMRMYDEAIKSDNRMFVTARGATWEFRPPGSFSSETFVFEGHKIPIDFQSEFMTTPTDAKAKYLTLPPKTAGAYFEYPERIDECVNKDRKPIFLTRDTVVWVSTRDKKGDRTERERLIGKEIGEWLITSVKEMSHARVGWTDLGRSRNRAALVIARGEPVTVEVRSESGEVQMTTVNKVIEEAVVVWTPDPERGLQVAIASVETLILDLLRRGLRIVSFGCDAWNSASLQETLKRHRLYVEEHVIDYNDYQLLQSLIYSGAADLLDHQLQYRELTRLIRVGSNKIDHPPEGAPSFGSKDIADSLAGCARLLNGNLKNPAAALAALNSKRTVAVRGQHTGTRNVVNNPFSAKAQGLPISGPETLISPVGSDMSKQPEPERWHPLPNDIRPRRSMGVNGGRGSPGRSFAGRTSGW